jgi:hypothetical protein
MSRLQQSANANSLYRATAGGILESIPSSGDDIFSSSFLLGVLESRMMTPALLRSYYLKVEEYNKENAEPSLPVPSTAHQYKYDNTVEQIINQNHPQAASTATTAGTNSPTPDPVTAPSGADPKQWWTYNNYGIVGEIFNKYA